MPALNQIFFGPPGTGKTYATIAAALEILDPVYLKANEKDREALKRRFDEFTQSGDVRFVTFHQSFSYEDFVEGLRADTDDNGQLRYTVVPGVFKSLCRQSGAGYRPFKMGDQFGKAYRVRYASSDVVKVEKTQGKIIEFGMSLLNGLADNVVSGAITVQDISDKSWEKKLVTSEFDPYIVNGYRNLLPIMIERMIGSKPEGLFDSDLQTAQEAPRVLIMDEINRGNVSRIFGELITLIEPSKRAGRPEALEVILPYSKERFSVPSTVHLIGTMNTSDRSLASMDIALRRRFTFIEVPPRPDLLEDVVVEGIAIDELLSVINARIAALLGRDYCLGHAYFMSGLEKPTLEWLAGVFKHNILPLLQEYFFEDWQRIQWVLNDQRKAPEFRFLIQPSQNLSQLFGDSVTLTRSNEQWELNDSAFNEISAYRGIIDHTLEAPLNYVPQAGSQGDITVNQLESGTIEVMSNGKLVKPAMPILRDLAKQYGIETHWGSGVEMNTRHLGARVIKALRESGQ